jgi:hypothetical protein
LDFDLSPGEDPVGRYGYGIQSYFNLIRQMICLTFILTIVHIPLMRSYSSFSEINTDYNSLSLGNLGQARTKCLNLKLGQLHNFMLGCGKGTSISRISHFGVYQASSQAAIEARCWTDPNDHEQASCLGVTHTSHPFYTSKLA